MIHLFQYNFYFLVRIYQDDHSNISISMTTNILANLYLQNQSYFYLTSLSIKNIIPIIKKIKLAILFLLLNIIPINENINIYIEIYN